MNVSCACNAFVVNFLWSAKSWHDSKIRRTWFQKYIHLAFAFHIHLCGITFWLLCGVMLECKCTATDGQRCNMSANTLIGLTSLTAVCFVCLFVYWVTSAISFLFCFLCFGWLVKNWFLLLLLLTLTSHCLCCLALPRVLEHVVAETKCFATGPLCNL